LVCGTGKVNLKDEAYNGLWKLVLFSSKVLLVKDGVLLFVTVKTEQLIVDMTLDSTNPEKKEKSTVTGFANAGMLRIHSKCRIRHLLFSSGGVQCKVLFKHV